LETKYWPWDPTLSNPRALGHFYNAPKDFYMFSQVHKVVAWLNPSYTWEEFDSITLPTFEHPKQLLDPTVKTQEVEPTNVEFDECYIHGYAKKIANNFVVLDFF
jgi:hypothetical protein